MTDKEKNREALKTLREQRRAALELAQTRLKDQIKTVNELTRILQQGPRTVPALAMEAKLPTATVFWHLIALKKYGKVVEGDQEGNYFQYRLASNES